MVLPTGLRFRESGALKTVRVSFGEPPHAIVLNRRLENRPLNLQAYRATKIGISFDTVGSDWGTVFSAPGTANHMRRRSSDRPRSESQAGVVNLQSGRSQMSAVSQPASQTSPERRSPLRSRRQSSKIRAAVQADVGGPPPTFAKWSAAFRASSNRIESFGTLMREPRGKNPWVACVIGIHSSDVEDSIQYRP